MKPSSISQIVSICNCEIALRSSTIREQNFSLSFTYTYKETDHYMKSLITSLAAAVAITAVASASASNIIIETGFSNATAQASAIAYQSVVNAAVMGASSGYGAKTVDSYAALSNQGLFGSNQNIAFKSTVTFGVTAGEIGNWSFRAGVDFGKGGAVFLDGKEVAFKNNDMWWAGNYANPTQFFQFSSNITAGNHTLNVYGLEGCCDGNQQVQFNSGSGFKSFDKSTLAPVPEPETYAMMLTGLGLLGFMSRRKNLRNRA
ncbi:CCXG family PEP-CTERM protein [Undibacterium sp.]|uniref:CCXG family PEP-CTERM protein n=1 Tax=Undibacterium sp. TaxID=1914977 RepID=UPI0026012218|nr:CCXG family PEP-CTERM protein [Undibacterium sp.]